MPLDGVMHLLSNPRGNGKTHIMAQMAQTKGRDAVLICANRMEMRRIKEAYPGDYEVKTIDASIYNLIADRGKILMFDHFAMAQILHHHVMIHGDVVRELGESKDEIEYLTRTQKKLRAQIQEFKKPKKKRGKK